MAIVKEDPNEEDENNGLAKDKENSKSKKKLLVSSKRIDSDPSVAGSPSSG